MKALPLLLAPFLVMGCSELTEQNKFRVIKESAAPAVIELPAALTATPKARAEGKDGAKPAAVDAKRRARPKPAAAGKGPRKG